MVVTGGSGVYGGGQQQQTVEDASQSIVGQELFGMMLAYLAAAVTRNMMMVEVSNVIDYFM